MTTYRCFFALVVMLSIHVDRAHANDVVVASDDPIVGHVADQPVHFSQIIESHLKTADPNHHDQLRQIVRARIQQIVLDRLILAEAEASLTDEEREAVSELVAKRVAQIDPADREAFARDFRQQVIARKHLRDTLTPQIHITDADIERDYQKRRAEFNPPARRTLRRIQALPSDADTVEKKLAEGASFKEVASGSLNQYRPSKAGLMGDLSVDASFADAAINEAVAALGDRPGAVTPRIDADGSSHWFYLEAYNAPPSRSLDQVRSEISDMLRQKQYLSLSQTMRRNLMDGGNYTPLDIMVENTLTLLDRRTD